MEDHLRPQLDVALAETGVGARGVPQAVAGADVSLHGRQKRIQPGRWDTSVGGHLKAGESYEDGAARELLEELGVNMKNAGGRAALGRLHDYVWRCPVETEHVRTFELAHDGPFTLHPAEIDEGRFWTEDELRAAVGTGTLTPNLEEELRRIGVLGG